MLAVRDSNDVPSVNKSLYYPEGYIFSTKLVDDKTVTGKVPVDLVSCDEIIDESFQYYKLIKNIDLKNYYCLDNRENELSIGEFWGNENCKMLQVKMFRCKGNDCASGDEIDSFLSEATVQIYSIKNYLNSKTIVIL